MVPWVLVLLMMCSSPLLASSADDDPMTTHFKNGHLMDDLTADDRCYAVLAGVRLRTDAATYWSASVTVMMPAWSR